MHTVHYIARRGFRRWYERELVRGHGQLVLLLLCAVAVMGAVEAFGQQHGNSRWLMVASIVVAGVVGAWAMKRYLFHLGRAEALARQAECPRCRAYARFAPQGEAREEGGQLLLPVCCRACQQQWTLRW